MKQLPITERDYYHQFPDTINQTGDIWTGLPTLGLLPQQNVSGVVITPSCDLVHHKSDTITYLPIVSISDYLSSISVIPELLTSLVDLANAISFDPVTGLIPKDSRNLASDLTAYRQLAVAHTMPADTKQKQSWIERKERLCATVDLVIQLADGGGACPNTTDILSSLGQKRADRIKRDIVRNSFKSDIHFLPRDNYDPAWSAVSQHSVVLFRYPITAPIQIFRIADDISIENWDDAIHTLGLRIELASHFKLRRPVRSSRIKHDFLPDLLTRYASLYLRIGSPDFTTTTIDTFVKELT